MQRRKARGRRSQLRSPHGFSEMDGDVFAARLTLARIARKRNSIVIQPRRSAKVQRGKGAQRETLVSGHLSAFAPNLVCLMNENTTSFLWAGYRSSHAWHPCFNAQHLKGHLPNIGRLSRCQRKIVCWMKKSQSVYVHVSKIRQYTASSCIRMKNPHKRVA